MDDQAVRTRRQSDPCAYDAEADRSQLPSNQVDDPPYVEMWHHYIHSQVDYSALGTWCRERRGQVTVCEAEGASWLPFRRFGAVKGGPARGTSQEVIWTSGELAPLGHLASGTL
jgi:hypothetical protein